MISKIYVAINPYIKIISDFHINCKLFPTECLYKASGEVGWFGPNTPESFIGVKGLKLFLVV